MSTNKALAGTGISGDPVVAMDDIQLPDEDVDPSVEWFKGRYKAQSQIAHGADTGGGITQRFRTMEVNVTDPETGEEYNEDVPYVSGNSIRGYIRDLLAEDYLRLLAEPDEDDIELRDPLFNTLWSGGTLERGTGPGKLRRRLIEDIREHIPMLSLLGSAGGTEIWEGRWKTGHLWPVCLETHGYTGIKTDRSVFGSYLDVDFNTRTDDREGSRDEDDAVSQMRFRVHVLEPGTPFAHRMALKGASDIDRACLGRAMELFATQPFVGGMSARGYGEVAFEYEQLPDASPYVEYVRDNRDDLREFVHDLDERFS